MVKGSSKSALIYKRSLILSKNLASFFAIPNIICEKLKCCIEKFATMTENNRVMEEKNRLRNLGINIKSERLRRNISQEKLAELTNISRNSISLIETGKINPTILKVIDIANVLNVDLNTLIREV